MATTGGGQDEWDQFHARNIQQKASHHPSDSPQDHSDSDSQDDYDNAQSSRNAAQPDTDIPWTGPRDVIPNRNFGYSTGPKGIIRDARDQRNADNISPNRQPRSQRNDHIAPYIDNLRDGQPRRRSPSSSDDDDAVFRDLEADNPAAARYDSARRTELHRNLRLQDVSGPSFEGMIAAADPHVMVVGFIYDDHPEIWHRLEFCIQSLARKYEGLRCVKLHYEEAKFERASAPAIVAFRDAEEVAHVLNVYEEVSVEELNVDAVEDLFQRYHIV